MIIANGEEYEDAFRFYCVVPDGFTADEILAVARVINPDAYFVVGFDCAPVAVASDEPPRDVIGETREYLRLRARDRKTFNALAPELRYEALAPELRARVDATPPS